jgi:hypothetical protein
MAEMLFGIRAISRSHLQAIGNIAVQMLDVSSVGVAHLTGQRVVSLAFIQVAFGQAIPFFAVLAHRIKGFPLVLAGLLAMLADDAVP